MPFSPVSRRGEVTADHLRELQRYCGDWQDWTPTVTQSDTITLTVTRARYLLVGKLATVTANLALTSAGVNNNTIVIGAVPAAVAPASTAVYQSAGWANYSVGGATHYSLQVWWASATTLKLVPSGQGNYLGLDTVTPDVTVANGDKLSLTLIYEVA